MKKIPAVKSLAGENFAGVHPIIFQAMAETNEGHVKSYGGDPYSMAAADVFRKVFKDIAGVHFVFNGTGGNVFALSTMVQHFNAVLCADVAHVYADESTAPETIAGCRLFPVESKDGKIAAEAIEKKIRRLGDQHHPQISAITITQSTELGTVYSIEELRAISAVAKKYNLLLHMDGTRLYNAAATLNCSLDAISREAGVDVLSLGGTKHGMLFGEAVVFFNRPVFEGSNYRVKRSAQLISKMRFVSCQFEAMLSGNLWLDIALHVNQLAAYLEKQLTKFEQVKITRPVQANAVFAIMPKDWIENLRKIMYFHTWNAEINEVRLICSFDLSKENIDTFIEAMTTLAEKDKKILSS